MKKALKIVSNLVTVILFLNLIMMVFLVISSKASGGEPQAFGYQFKTVLSGSMEPTFRTGSVIAVKQVKDKNSLKKGEIVTFIEEPGKFVTHRIIDVVKQGEDVLYTTKGDNNEEKDINPVFSDNVVAKYSGFTIPYLGYFIDFTQSPKGMAIILIIPGVILIGYASLTIYQAIKEIENKTKLANTDSNSKAF